MKSTKKIYIYCKPIYKILFVCLVSDTTAFAANQQGGNIQSASGVRNIQGLDNFKPSLGILLIRVIYRHQSCHTECILPYETECVKAAIIYFSSQAKNLDLDTYMYLRLKRWVFKFYLIYYSTEEENSI